MRIHIPVGRAALAALLGLLVAAPNVLAAPGSRRPPGPAATRPTPHNLVSNPLLVGGQPVPCPDPDALQIGSRPYTVEIACTSDRNEGDAPGSAFALYRTHNLRNITRDGWIFPPGHEPFWALASPGGQYWAPTIVHIGHNWVAYFSAEVNQAVTRIPMPGQTRYTMVLGVAWGPTLHTMWTHTRILHWRGQFNGIPGNGQEVATGVIDPSIARDPLTHTLYIAFCNQPNQIMLGTLTANGLVMHRRLLLVSRPTLGWEGFASAAPVEEGPVLIWNGTLRAMTMIVNTGDTWTGDYREGFLVSFNPAAGVFYKFPWPIFHSGNGLIGPGMGSAPLLGPDGSTEWVYMHEQLTPAPDPADPYEMQRYLALEPYRPAGRATMLVPLLPGDVRPPDPRAIVDRPLGKLIRVPVPQIGSGQTQRTVATPFLATAPAAG